MASIFLAATILFLILLLYPYSLYSWITHVVAKVRRPPPTGEVAATHRTIDIVLCAYNEERCLAAKIENCLAISSAYPDVRIHVYSDGSTDRTADLIKDFGDRVDCVISSSRRGKSAGITCLLERCTGELVVFTDANVLIDVEAFANIYRHFADVTVGCISGNLQYINADESVVASIGASYWGFEQRLKLLESASGSTVGADGSLFVIRRHLFRAVPEDIIDDMFTSLSILCDGYRVLQVSDVVAYERSTTKSSEEFARKVRIACRCYNCHRLLWPRLRKLPPLDLFKYVSHKLLRWYGGVWIVGATVSWLLFAVALGMAWLGTVPLIGIAVVLAFRSGGPVHLRRTGEILAAIFAASLGVVKSLRGESFQTWGIAPTSRGVDLDPSKA